MPADEINSRTTVSVASEPGAAGRGFAAAAVQPVAAHAVSTDATGLDAGSVVIPVGDFAMPAYRAQPAGRRNLPVVLVASEIFGVHEHIADVCRRLARRGYLAIAPALFVRHGDAGAYTDTARLIAEVVSPASDAQVNADLDAVVAWAAGHGGDVGRLGITGFCWGGRMTWRYAAHNPALRAGVAWYGPVARSYHPGDATIVALADRVRAPVLGLYGGADPGIPVETLSRLEAALQAAGHTASEFVVYPDAPHAFHADYRPSYRQAAAQDGWARCLAWFEKHGVA